MSHDVFVSYASEDETKALRIVGFLQNQGVICWIDKQGIRLGREYDAEIEQAIRRSCALVWIVSQQSATKEYVKSEVSTAHHCKKTIVPVFLEKVDLARLPEPFRFIVERKQGIELFTCSEEQELARLAEELRALIQSCRRMRFGIRAGLIAAVLAVSIGAWVNLSRSSDQQSAAGSNVRAFDATATHESMPPARTLPLSVAALPAADVLKVAYTGFPPVPSAEYVHPQLQMEIVAHRAGETSFVPLKDGDALTSQKDDYVILAPVLSPGWLYVFQVDAVGKKDWLFPKNDTSQYSSGSNPVKPGQIAQIPSEESDHVLYLDTTTGIEHVYAVFSATRWPELEQALESKSPAPVGTPVTGTDSIALRQAVLEPIGLELRGVGGERKSGSAQDSLKQAVNRLYHGQTVSLPVVSDPLIATGPLLVVERWFRHEAPR